MGKGLLSEEQFGRVVVTRARRERPDIRVKSMGKSVLVVESEPGRQRLLSLSDLYQAYCDSPTERDQVIGHFLSRLVYQEPPEVRGDWAENRVNVMPQLVPPSLLEFCRDAGRELASIEYVGELSIAFVVDEPERYSYIQRALAEDWGVSALEMLATGVRNLELMNTLAPEYQRFGTDERTTLVWETFDGYDASRLLLTRELVEMAARVPGNPVVAVPHRDYLVMFGDADPLFVEEMAERIRGLYESHSYPVSPRLFTISEGGLRLYEGAIRHPRLIS